MSSEPGRGSRRRGGRAILALIVAVCLPVEASVAAALALEAGSFVEGYRLGAPGGLVSPDRMVGLRIVDREGRLLREPLGGQGDRGRWVGLDEVSPHVVPAVIAAEDERFRMHPGVDPLAVLRAAAQDAASGRIVSGASTITQQLVKLTTGGVGHPRTPWLKAREMMAALHYERGLGKDGVLEAYLNWVPFGHLARGVEMASWTYFDRPAAHLSLSEASALAAMVQGPAAMDPWRHPEILERRRLWVLGRMRESGAIGDEEYGHARSTPPAWAGGEGAFRAPHLAEEILERARERRFSSGKVITTIDLDLQRAAEQLTAAAVADLRSSDVTNAAVVVVHNPTGEIRAWVGSTGWFNAADGGMNDGVTARRSPGSALKPFVYAAAFERGWTPASMIADVETWFPTPQGPYRPRNYDGMYHGPVLAREALGSSFNVPAVIVTADLGPAAVLESLHGAGFESLDREPSHYGVAIALGDGEVTLLELAAAYSALARGGLWKEPVLVGALEDPSGRSLPLSGPGSRRAFDERTAWLVTSILSDPAARAPGFGDAPVFDLGFPVAVKTGTSHDYRDNWTVGYTREYTVAAWAGNFSGKPMGNVSGITGAGPLFRAVMLEAMRTVEDANHGFDRPDGIVERRVCALSGALAGPSCKATRVEVFDASNVPEEHCPVHGEHSIDLRNGLLAGPGCPASVIGGAVFETYPPDILPWAVAAGRPVLPPFSGLCPGGAGQEAAAAGAAGGAPSVLKPADGSTFAIDPDVPAGKHVVLVKMSVPSGSGTVTLVVDGKPAGKAGPPWEVEWVPTPGDHVLAARQGGVTGDPVTVHVE